MERSQQHRYRADITFDGGDLDCGNGLLLLIRKHLDSLDHGQLLEIRSTEISVEEDLPAWCRLTENQLVSWVKNGSVRSFLVCKGSLFIDADRYGDGPVQNGSADEDPEKHDMADRDGDQLHEKRNTFFDSLTVVDVSIPKLLPPPVPAMPVPPLAVTGIGSWPRPEWLMQSLHERLTNRLSEEEFQHNADRAVRLCVVAQERCGVDVVTDGEQRRDNYASFVGSRLDNCVLIPLTDLLPLVDHPHEFKAEMDSLDVPADRVRHPVVFGKLGRGRSIALHEHMFVKQTTDKPVKVALPGPYLLTRTMWMECITDKAYQSREQLSRDIVRVLKEEIHFLLAAGVSIVQLDEPVLTEIAMGHAHNSRTFMCGALSNRLSNDEEFQLASGLLNQVTEGLPRERLALHVCRGNWTPDESVALSGGYEPLLPLFCDLKNIGILFLEFCTPRAGDLSIIAQLPSRTRIGLGVVNPKDPAVESVDSIIERIGRATGYVDIERLLLNPDCGFATFADNPVTSCEIAEKKLAAMARAASLLRG